MDMTWIAVGGVVAVALGVNTWFRSRPAPLSEAWRDFAGVQGLRMKRGQAEFFLYGKLQGFDAEVEGRYVRVSLDTNRYEWRVSLRLAVRPFLPEGFSLAPQGALEEAGQRLGLVAEEKLGDELVDPVFVLHGLTPEVRAVLTDTLMQRNLLELRATHEGYRIHDGWLETRLPGKPEDLGQLEACVEPLLETVRLLGKTMDAVRSRQ